MSLREPDLQNIRALQNQHDSIQPAVVPIKNGSARWCSRPKHIPKQVEVAHHHPRTSFAPCLSGIQLFPLQTPLRPRLQHGRSGFNMYTTLAVPAITSSSAKVQRRLMWATTTTVTQKQLTTRPLQASGTLATFASVSCKECRGAVQSQGTQDCVLGWQTSRLRATSGAGRTRCREVAPCERMKQHRACCQISCSQDLQTPPIVSGNFFFVALRKALHGQGVVRSHVNSCW